MICVKVIMRFRKTWGRIQGLLPSSCPFWLAWPQGIVIACSEAEESPSHNQVSEPGTHPGWQLRPPATSMTPINKTYFLGGGEGTRAVLKKVLVQGQGQGRYS